MKRMIICLSMLAAFGLPGLVSAQTLSSIPGLPGFSLPANVSLGNLSLYGGMATDWGMTKHSFVDPVSTNSLLFEEGPLSACYLGFALPIQVPTGTFRMAGSLTIPVSSTTDYFRGFGGVYIPLPPLNADRMWTTAEALYAHLIGGGFSALVGFRWDRWDTGESQR